MASNPEYKRKRLLESGVILEKETVAIYENYKEPLKKVEKGFGFQGVIATNEAHTHIQCHICGYFFKTLANHIKTHENMTIDQYKDTFGLMRKSVLISDDVRSQRIKIYNSLPQAVHEQIKKNFEKRTPNEERDTKGRKSNWSLERRNRDGLCPDQLLDKIKTLTKELNHCPTVTEFIQKYSTHYLGAIKNMYGSYNNAVKLAGFKPNRKGGQVQYSRQELIKYLQEFYTKYKRTPSTSDFNRGYLPAKTTYLVWFGSLNDARAAAGIPTLVPLGGKRWVEVPAMEAK